MNRLKEAIVRAVPDVQRTVKRGAFAGTVETRPITLADVLRAIHSIDPEKRPMYLNVGCDGGFYTVRYTYPDGNKCVIEHEGIGTWDLQKDLDGQSPETIAFLEGILCK